uniref:Reverse transcriptase zinc-binding domain-containing protein n=1 Tax=Cannabis sativa TaxID=3483 RepID=A0A803NM50_CANSA
MLVEQLVEYEWLPSKCLACGNLGHVVANCNKEKPKVWKKKQPSDFKEDKKEVPNQETITGDEKNLNNRCETATETGEEKAEIMIIWQDKFVQVEILDEDTQLVHCRVKSSGQKVSFFITVVYGSNSMDERRNLWHKLEGYGLLHEPWIIFGDFTAMFSFQDKNGGRPVQAKDILDAQTWLANGQVEEFKCSSAFYTWNNKHEVGERIYSKLDRVFINDIWLNAFPNAEACFKWETVCDHSYCLIQNHESNKVGVKPFRFCNHWPTYPNFRRAVISSWNRPTAGSNLEKIVKKLYRVKHTLKSLANKKWGMLKRSTRLLKSNTAGFKRKLLPIQLTLTFKMLLMSKRRSFLLPRTGSCLSVEQQVRLIKPFTIEDVKKVMFSIPSTKSPGLDGFGSGFFKDMRSEIDDLVLFSKGNLNSMRIIQEAFSKFCNATGLSANKAKSQIFFGEVKDVVERQILDLVQMEEGSFPLKYLGVNLPSTKWKASDCGVILDKINKNLNCWTSRNLSFAGRNQLIHSVLLGIRNYWISIFLIPQKITVAIDKSCRDFLWGKKGKISKLHLASWEKVCLPKKFGGKGFREGKKWNKALMTNFFGLYLASRIIFGYSINLEGQSIRNYPSKPETSWYFKKLLNLRVATSDYQLTFAVKGRKFSATRFYNQLVIENRVDYAGWVWDRLVIPKHSFVYWQLLNLRLLTRDKLIRIMPIYDIRCLVCELKEESHDHVLFDCLFAKLVFLGSA